MKFNIRKLARWYFDKWYRPLIPFMMIVLIFIIAAVFNKPQILVSVYYILFPATLLLFVAILYQLINRKSLSAFISGGVLGIVVLAVFFYILGQVFISMTTEDRFADNLKIPENVELAKPAGDGYGTIRPGAIVNKKRKGPDFQLYNSLQPGLYEYDVWLGKVEPGTVYLKAYEITKNLRLSAGRLSSRSSMKVENNTEEIRRFQSNGDFTIYEGDWGKPYAARFEIWYKPHSGSERKLIEKNFIIEGWQR